MKKNRGVSLHETNKNMNNKVTWNYSANDWQSPFIVMVKICHCCYCAIYWYYWKFTLFNEWYIILLSIIWCFNYYGNMMTKITIMMETKTITTPNTSFTWIKNVGILHAENRLQVAMICKIHKRRIRSDYIQVACQKVNIIN